MLYLVAVIGAYRHQAINLDKIILQRIGCEISVEGTVDKSHLRRGQAKGIGAL